MSLIFSFLKFLNLPSNDIPGLKSQLLDVDFSRHAGAFVWQTIPRSQCHRNSNYTSLIEKN